MGVRNFIYSSIRHCVVKISTEVRRLNGARVTILRFTLYQPEYGQLSVSRDVEGRFFRGEAEISTDALASRLFPNKKVIPAVELPVLDKTPPIQIIGPFCISFKRALEVSTTLAIVVSALVNIYKNDSDPNSYCGIEMPEIDPKKPYRKEDVNSNLFCWYFLFPTKLLTKEKRATFLQDCACSLEKTYPEMDPSTKEIFVYHVCAAFLKNQTGLSILLGAGRAIISVFVFFPIVRSFMLRTVTTYTVLPSGLVVSTGILIISGSLSKQTFDGLSWVTGKSLIVIFFILSQVNQVILGVRNGIKQYNSLQQSQQKKER